jgi:hypothetical protein
MERKLETVLERDMDLLVMEEFFCSKEFQNFFLRKTVRGKLKFLFAKHSVTNAIGESDIEVDFIDTKNKIVRFLIENKINAQLQPNQIERYHQRGKTEKESGKIFDFKVILLCPKEYIKCLNKRPDYILTYEDILEWFNSKKDIRSKYKSDIIKISLEKSIKNPLIRNDIITNFWNQYYKLIIKMAPELQMKKPGDKGSKSFWAYLKPAGLPINSSIVNKLEKGHIDLEIKNKASEIRYLRQIKLDKGMYWTTAGKSASIRITVPVIDIKKDFSEQYDKIIEGINASKSLLEFINKNSNRIEI